MMGQSFNPADVAVLVVEDDALLRAEAVDLCIEAGFTTYEARNADQAIRLLERHSEIRVLFTRHRDGGLDGRLEAGPRRAGALAPGRHHGHVGAAQGDEGGFADNGLFFAKPYPPDDIVKALNGIAAQVMG